jgi:hypothetical protein
MKNRLSIYILATLLAIVLGSSSHVQAEVIYSSFGPAPGYSNAGYTAGWGPCGFSGTNCQTELAAGFTSTLDYTLDSISFAASYVAGEIDSLSISLASGETQPGAILESFTFTNLSSEPSIYSADSLTHSLLSAGTQYWFVFSPHDQTAITWWTGSQYIPPTLLTGYGSGTWIPGTPLAGQTAFSVEGTPVSAPVPEPATMLLVSSGLLGLAGFRRKFKK